jgi:hypothetical protein
MAQVRQDPAGTKTPHVMRIKLKTFSLFSLILFLAMSVLPAKADKRAIITFEATTYNFGDLYEADGDATCTFKFTNTGTAPLLLVRAQASCGCTSPEYPKQPIRPGESGTITVTYHAKGRPGAFQKSIYVYDNSAPNHSTTLIITGYVKSSKKPEENYSQQLGGGLRLKVRTLSFFDLYPNQSAKTRSFSVYNESIHPIQLTFQNMPKHLYVESDPQIIPAKQEGKILVTYYTSRVKDWGMRKDYFDVLVKGYEAQMTGNRLAVTADIREDFSKLSTKEKAEAPVIEVSQRSINFGTTSTQKKSVVTVTNNGKSKLLIRKLQNDEPDIFPCSLSTDQIKPGETAEITVTYCPEKSSLATMNHHITLISNDPNNSHVIINMTAGK